MVCQVPSTTVRRWRGWKTRPTWSNARGAIRYGSRSRPRTNARSPTPSSARFAISSTKPTPSHKAMLEVSRTGRAFREVIIYGRENRSQRTALHESASQGEITDLTPDENTPTEAHYSRNPRVIRRQVGGETVLVPLAGPDAANLEYLYRLNATGSALWDLLEKPLSADELTDGANREPRRRCTAARNHRGRCRRVSRRHNRSRLVSREA